MKQPILSKDGVSYIVPFILITSCFALWGFANDITNPMVKAFSKIFRMSATDGALVQVAFYGGYFAMAFPAAMFIRRYSYKAGVLVGLGLYALGAKAFPLCSFLSGKDDGRILSVPRSLLHPHMRTVVPRDIVEPVHPIDGNRRDGNTPTEPCAVVQPDGLIVGHVRGYELHPG